MLYLKDIRDYIASLDITENRHVYMGKMDNKNPKSIGVYPLCRAVPNKIPLGGLKNGSYGTKNVSILIHWNKSPRDTEEAAEKLFNKLQETRNITVNNQIIKFIDLLVDEPQDIATDADGIYEMVIEAGFIYERRME